jgi:4-hydroxy 2-oxovalerate aldolase
VAVLKKSGYEVSADFYKTMDVVDNIFNKIVPEPVKVNNTTLMLGYAGVYSSFLHHAYKAAEKFKVDARDILIELGERKIVGGRQQLIKSYKKL